MRSLRSALALSLALVLALTSLSLAVARGQGTPAGEIVICTGMGLQAVTVDAGGNPVGPPHLCPDGVAAIAALALAAPDPVAVARAAGEARRAMAPPRAEGRDAPRPRSRGPPPVA